MKVAIGSPAGGTEKGRKRGEKVGKRKSGRSLSYLRGGCSGGLIILTSSPAPPRGARYCVRFCVLNVYMVHAAKCACPPWKSLLILSMQIKMSQPNGVIRPSALTPRASPSGFGRRAMSLERRQPNSIENCMPTVTVAYLLPPFSCLNPPLHACFLTSPAYPVCLL